MGIAINLNIFSPIYLFVVFFAGMELLYKQQQQQQQTQMVLCVLTMSQSAKTEKQNRHFAAWPSHQMFLEQEKWEEKCGHLIECILAKWIIFVSLAQKLGLSFRGKLLSAFAPFLSFSVAVLTRQKKKMKGKRKRLLDNFTDFLHQGVNPIRVGS